MYKQQIDSKSILHIPKMRQVLTVNISTNLMLVHYVRFLQKYLYNEICTGVYIGRCWFRRWRSITHTNWNSVQHRKASFWLCLYSCRLCDGAAFVINSEHLDDVLYWIDLLSNYFIKWMRVTNWGGFVVSNEDCAVRDVGLSCFETMWFALLHTLVAKPFVLHS